MFMCYGRIQVESQYMYDTVNGIKHTIKVTRFIQYLNS